jgi:hypothetical protein
MDSIYQRLKGFFLRSKKKSSPDAGGDGLASAAVSPGSEPLSVSDGEAVN